MEYECTINIKGSLFSLDEPVVMGILNVTPDSFYSSSRVSDDELIARAKAMINEGAKIIDVGACSTRPGAEPVSQKEELSRLHSALTLIDKELPDAVVSLDTFRGEVALECVKEHNVSIINDVSGYDWDDAMFDAVCKLRMPYVLTHSPEKPGALSCGNNLVPDVIKHLSQKMWQLRQEGVADIIIDPGFGFGKSLEQNYELFASMGELSLLDAPLLVGISRKSMITKLLGISVASALSGTVALNMAALERGAKILRVHDVNEAVQVVALWKAIKCNI
mgnify:CR=1 FL=1